MVGGDCGEGGGRGEEEVGAERGAPCAGVDAVVVGYEWVVRVEVEDLDAPLWVEWVGRGCWRDIVTGGRRG